jgi:iron complex outermembrane receptor protein
MTTSPLRAQLRLAASAAALLIAAPALAQQQPEAEREPDASETIIVTARLPGTQSYRAENAVIGTKTDTPLIETPISASVVTRQFLDDTQVTTITDALRFVPGVYSGDNGRAAVDENLSIRGFSYLRSTFVDGTRQQAFNIDVNPEPYGLERIEVLRGAASVLYGSTQPGGIVNSVSRRPRTETQGEVLVSGGSLDLLRLGFDVTGALDGKGKVAARLTGFLRNQDDLADTAFNNRRYIAPAISFFPSERTEITLLGSYQKDNFRLVPYLPADGTLRPNPNGTIPRERFLGEPGLPDDNVDTFGAKLIVRHEFSDSVVLNHVTGYRDYSRFTNYIFPELAPGGRVADRSIFPITTNANVWSTDTNLQIKGDWVGGQHSLLIGADYYQIRDRSVTEGATLGPIDAFDPIYGDPGQFSGVLTNDSFTSLKQYGFYFQDQVKLGERLVLLAGGRFDSFKLRFDDPLSGFSDRIDDDLSFTARAGAVYLLDGGFAPYVSYTQGFYPQGGVDAQGNGFEPDESDQWEAGLKYESPDGRSSASVALFTITRSNLLSPDPTNPNFSIATGEQRHRGVEVEFNLSLTPELGVLGSYAYLDARITRNDQLIDGQSIEGKRPPNVPEHSAALWAVYSFAKGTALEGLSISGGTRIQSPREGDTLNTFDTPAFALFDASIAYSFDKWRIAVNAINLADKRYVSATTGFSDYVRFGDPRLILASVTRAF